MDTAQASPTSVSTQIHPTAQQMSSEPEHPNIRHINLATDRLCSLLSGRPYILSVPETDLPFDRNKVALEHHYWLKQYPLFTRDDSHKQYSTYLVCDLADSCLEVRSEIDEQRERLARERPSNMMATTPATPSLTGTTVAKKKISLSDYKKKVVVGSKSQSPRPARAQGENRCLLLLGN